MLERSVGSGRLADLGLRRRDEAGIVGQAHAMLSRLLESGLHDEFEGVLRRLRAIMPGFVPRKPRRLSILSAIVGVGAALRLERLVRSLPPSRRVPVADQVKEYRRRKGDRVEPVENTAVALDH
jgi:hypothetical protein